MAMSKQYIMDGHLQFVSILDKGHHLLAQNMNDRILRFFYVFIHLFFYKSQLMFMHIIRKNILMPVFSSILKRRIMKQ